MPPQTKQSKEGKMDINAFKEKIVNEVSTISFEETMSVIEKNYNFSETAFTNGDVENSKGENSGSCKLLYFCKINNFDKSQTLNCFGEYYRKDVLGSPQGKDHGNIRNFMKSGFEKLSFEGEPLILK